MQADILTLSSMGCHPLSVVTAVTIQDTMGVEDVLPIDAEWVADQARCVLEDMPVAVFKIGLLGSVETIAAIAEVVSDYPDIPLVLDPVLASGRGDELASEDMISAMRELLIPQTTLITPNSLEARRLAQDDGRRRRRSANWTNARAACWASAASTCSLPAPTRIRRRSSTRCTTSRAWCAPIPGSGCPGPIMARAARSPRRSRRRSPTAWAFRGGARCAGIHLANAQARISDRHGPADPRPTVLGARGRAGGWRRKLAALYAVTPELARHGWAVAQGRSRDCAAARVSCSTEARQVRRRYGCEQLQRLVANLPAWRRQPVHRQ